LDEVQTVPPIAPDEAFQIGGAVHVGDRHDTGLGVFAEDFFKLCPSGEHLLQVCHIRHTATGFHVGQDDGLIIAPENIGTFCHEMNAREDDVLGVDARTFDAELVAIALKIGKAHDFVALIVVS
jgi:hypothetical protein